jgi:hypothetical protein
MIDSDRCACRVSILNLTCLNWFVTFSTSQLTSMDSVKYDNIAPFSSYNLRGDSLRVCNQFTSSIFDKTLEWVSIIHFIQTKTASYFLP